MEYQSCSRAETEALGRALAASLRPGDVVALLGPMGAGKTAFAGGVAQGLGVTGPVTSPTFTLVNEYRGRLPLLHFDLYRLTGPEDLWDLGWEDYLARGGVCLVEWPQIAGAELLPTVTVTLTPTGDETRSIIIQREDEHANSGL